MMYQSLTLLVDQRIISHSDGLNSIFAADTLDDAIRRFGTAFPVLKTDAGEFSRYAASVSYDLNAFKQVLGREGGAARYRISSHSRCGISSIRIRGSSSPRRCAGS